MKRAPTCIVVLIVLAVIALQYPAEEAMTGECCSALSGKDAKDCARAYKIEMCGNIPCVKHGSVACGDGPCSNSNLGCKSGKAMQVISWASLREAGSSNYSDTVYRYMKKALD
jgi:hypothetical protein